MTIADNPIAAGGFICLMAPGTFVILRAFEKAATRFQWIFDRNTGFLTLSWYCPNLEVWQILLQKKSG
jgi:hypothetical protein